MPLRLNGIVVDCADPVKLATFWASALGWGTREIHSGELAIARSEPSDGQPPIVFQRVPEPKASKNRVHIDLALEPDALVGTALHDERREAEVARLIALGGTRLRDVVTEHSGVGETWTVMADPEGNEFCVGF